MTEGSEQNRTPQRAREGFEGITNPRQRAFLEALAVNPSISSAAAAAGISRTTPYAWLGRVAGSEPDEAFCAAFDLAQEIGAESLVECAVERAKRDSDRLLEFLLKSFIPARFRERQILDANVRQVEEAIELVDRRGGDPTDTERT